MKANDSDKPACGNREMSSKEKINKLLRELDHCTKDELKEKIVKMNDFVGEMDEKEFESTLSKELFNEIVQMTEEKKLSAENAITFLKNMGYYKVLKNISVFEFDQSSLGNRIVWMIIEEEKKNEKKNDKILIDLCECCLFLKSGDSSKLLPVCVSCLLKVATNKDENREARNEVEMSLLALNNIEHWEGMKQELVMEIIKEIIEYHQKHFNLTQLAYQSVWQLMINQLSTNKCLEGVVVNELHFAREAKRELEELTRSVDWKKMNFKLKEIKEVQIITKWIQTLSSYFWFIQQLNDKNEGLIRCLVNLCKATRGNERDLHWKCIVLFQMMAPLRTVSVCSLLRGGAIDFILEEFLQSTSNDKIAWNCLRYFISIARRLNSKTDYEKDEIKRKITKMEIIEKMEEKGYEDVVGSFWKTIDFLNGRYYCNLSFNFEVYFIVA